MRVRVRVWVWVRVRVRVHQESVWAHVLAAHCERCEHDRLVGREALRDPVLGGTLVGRVQHKLLRRRIVGRLRLDDQARLHPGEPLGQSEAAELPRLLDGVERGDLLGPAHREHGAEAQAATRPRGGGSERRGGVAARGVAGKWSGR